MMLGSIGELRPLQFQTPDRHYGASITLIARRSTQRIGTRHWRRGADTQACSYPCTAGSVSADGIVKNAHCCCLVSIIANMAAPAAGADLAASVSWAFSCIQILNVNVMQEISTISVSWPACRISTTSTPMSFTDAG